MAAVKRKMKPVTAWALVETDSNEISGAYYASQPHIWMRRDGAAQSRMSNQRIAKVRIGEAPRARGRERKK